MYGGMWTFSFGPILLFVGFLLLIWIFASGHADHTDDPGDSALDILNKRYAKGEITKKQYLEIKKDIS